MIARPAAFDRAIFVLLALLVAGTPLALGAVQAWSLAAAEWLCLLLVLVWLLRAVWIPPAYDDPRLPPPGATGLREGGLSLLGHRLTPTGLAVPILLFVLLALVQIAPLPPGLLRALSPSTARLYETTLPGWGGGQGVDFSRVGATLDGPGGQEVVSRILAAPPVPGLEPSGIGSALRTVSIYPYATIGRLVLFLALAGLFGVVVNVFRTGAQIEAALRGIVLFGFALALLGVIQRLSWNGKIYWTIPVSPEASPFGPFVNHNHFAAYLAMIVPVATGMLMDEARRLSGRGRSRAGAPGEEGAMGPAPVRAAPRVGSEPLARLTLAAFVVAVMAGAMVLAASRGAVLALAAAAILYGGALAYRGRIGRAETVVAVLLLAAAIGVSAWLGAGPLAAKLKAIGDVETEPSLFSRVIGWQWTVAIAGDHPLLGTGLGTFADAWTRYYPPGTTGVWREAHNDYLQLLAETGAVGLVLFAIGFGIFLWRYILPGVLSRRRMDSYAFHGVAVGILAAAAHSIVDFPLQVTACAVLFVLLGGLLVVYRVKVEERA